MSSGAFFLGFRRGQGLQRKAIPCNRNVLYFDYHRNMETDTALASLSALAQKARLSVFRHLVQLGPAGACPGDIAEHLAMSGSTLSFHLKALAHAGLIQAEQIGRSIVYRADFAAMQGLLDYLTENCCGGNEALCAPACAPGPAHKPAKTPKSTRRLRHQ